jgi:MFS family permease
LTAGGGVINSKLQRQGGIGACTMDAITLVAFIGSVYLAGRIAERRGRRFKVWAGIAAIVGPLALPLVLLLPNLQNENGNRA